MKKALSLFLTCLLLFSVSVGPALAKSDKSKGQGKPATKQTFNKQSGLQKSQQVKAAHNKTVKLEQKTQNSLKIQKNIRTQLKEQFKEQKQLLKSQVLPPCFTDIQDHWAENCINLMSATGLFNGYTDGTFKPDQSITQAETISLIIRMLANEDTVDEDTADEDIDGSLEDVPDWAKEASKKAAKKGIINVNRFHSQVQASRTQTAVWIAKALSLDPVDESEVPFKDNLLISKEDIGYIMALYQEGIIKGTPSGKFNPNSAITRAEMATIMQNILDQGVPESLELNETTATMSQGEELTLTATVHYSNDTADDEVTWSSSDTSLATVEDGIVTAAADKTGVVIITASITKAGVTLEKSCEITIEEVTTEATDNSN